MGHALPCYLSSVSAAAVLETKTEAVDIGGLLHRTFLQVSPRSRLEMTPRRIPESVHSVDLGADYFTKDRLHGIIEIGEEPRKCRL